MQPWECNGVVSVGGVVVRPGDIIVGDQDGVRTHRPARSRRCAAFNQGSGMVVESDTRCIERCTVVVEGAEERACFPR